MAPVASANRRVAKPNRNSSKPDKKGKNSRRKQSFSQYINKLVKEVHRDASISRKAVSIMNAFVNDIFERIATEASRMSRMTKKPLVTSKEIQAAVKLLLPSELAHGPKRVTNRPRSSA